MSSFSAFNCSFQSLTFCRIDFFDLLLMAGVKLTKCFPHLFSDSLGLNVYPRKSNDMFSCSSFLSASLQYTILVFVGCISSLHLFSYLRTQALYLLHLLFYSG